MKYTNLCWFLLIVLGFSSGRKHQLSIINDSRSYFPISTFGFYRNGYLQVDVTKFKITPGHQSQIFGFSLEKIANRFTEQNLEKCQLKDFHNEQVTFQHIYFLFNLDRNVATLNCSKEMETIHIVKSIKEIEKMAKKGPLKKLRDTVLFQKTRRSIDSNPASLKISSTKPVTVSTLESTTTIIPSENTGQTLAPSTAMINGPGLHCERTIPMTFKDNIYNFSFVVFVANQQEEGLYSLNFLNCDNSGHNKTKIDMELNVIEKNPDDNYLSAGEMPLPALYFMMSLLFFLSSFFWFFLLKKSKDPVFKIHHLMGLVVVIKALSLLFHGNNYHFIQTEGVHMEAWAVMYYIMHLLKGALLFTVLALIGSGWAFIKHVLSSKEKKIFMIVIPLQIIANVATIIIEETEESNSEHETWVQLLYLIDFLCCVAILLPVVWSIKHLQEASQTDGKAAMNLRKLKLFRHFYIMIVCYIYFTRIIVALLRITVPYQYEWLYEMFNEMATYVFFVMTGYKFRPANNNPYFLVDTDDEEEMDEVLTTTGLTEGVTRINKKTSQSSSTTNLLQVEVYEDDDEVNLLPSVSKESSHEYD